MINTSKVINLMIQYKMTSLDEFMIMYCVYTKDLKSLHKYIENRVEHVREDGSINRHFSIELIKSMADRGILDASYLNFRTNKIDFLDLYITDSFAEKFFVDSMQAGEELYDAYPNSTEINGQFVILKKGQQIGNVYYGKDLLIEMYAKKIGNDIDKHRKVIEITKKAKEAGIINFTLRSYILDELWDSLEVPETPQSNKTII